jgi:mono/diheme cytochrome c family protein
MLHYLCGPKATAVVFLSFECPVALSYMPTLAELAKAYSERGVAFVGIHAGDEASAAEIAQKTREAKLPFPVLVDATGAAVAGFTATATPEVFVLDAERIVRYRGRIDDRYATRQQQKARPQRDDSRLALDEVLAGKAVSVAATRAIGCPLRQARPVTAGKVTYHRDVVPLLQQHCQSCHRPGEVAPFSLMTYRQAVRWADDIKEYTRSRKMPPWKPVEGATFAGARRLTDEEIATLAAWVDGGTPEGNPLEAPAPRRFADGWQLGEPDLVLTMDEDFELGATGTDLYRCFVLPTSLGEDRYVAAVEVRPGNRRIVHHALMFADRWGRAKRLEEQARLKETTTDVDRGPGYSLPISLAFWPGFLPSGGLSGWAPGILPHPLPEGVGYRLPRNADVVLQLHYHRTGRVEKDRTSVGFYFAKNASRHVQGLAVPANFLTIPADEANYRVEGKMWVRQDCRLHTIMPHMHLLGRRIKVTMTPPDGPAQTLVAVDDWDFNWQENFYFREPLAVKAGTRFDVEGIYDNSAANPFNPFQPPRRVRAGLQTTDEMCVGFMGATSDRPGPIRFDVGIRLPWLGWLPGVPGFGL